MASCGSAECMREGTPPARETAHSRQPGNGYDFEWVPMKLWFEKTAFPLVACLFIAGCTEAQHPGQGDACGAAHIRIIKAVLDDAELKAYGKNYFSGSPDIEILWDGAPAPSTSCTDSSPAFVVSRSSSRRDHLSSRYVGVNKLYYDDSAAYIELMLRPTGMNGDFFLRKEQGKWKVKMRELYEE